MELGFALVAALVFLAWLTERRALLWAAFMLALGLGSGLSLSGHSSATAGETVADWFHLAAATLWIGGLLQLSLVARNAAAFRRFSRLATVCVAVLIGAGTYLSVERVPALHDLWATGYGQVLLVKLSLVCVALLWAAFVLALGLSSGLSLSGHSSATAGETLADWFHLAAATLWIGGLLQLALVARNPAAFRRFSRLATVCVAVLIGAGTYLSVERFPALHDLWETGYGRVLLAKLSLVCVALLWGAAHQFLVLPRLDRVGNRLARSLLAESAVATAVLLVAAILVDSRPPPRSGAAGSVGRKAADARPSIRQPSAAGAGSVGGKAAEARPSIRQPSAAGAADARLSIRQPSAAGSPVTSAHARSLAP
jgi:putative copper export protein